MIRAPDLSGSRNAKDGRTTVKKIEFCLLKSFILTDKLYGLKRLKNYYTFFKIKSYLLYKLKNKQANIKTPPF